MDTTDARPLAVAGRLQHDPRQDPRAPRTHLTSPRAQPTPEQTSRPTPAREACPETVTRHRSVTLARRRNANRARNQASDGPEDRSPRPKPPRQPPAPPLLGVFRLNAFRRLDPNRASARNCVPNGIAAPRSRADGPRSPADRHPQTGGSNPAPPGPSGRASTRTPLIPPPPDDSCVSGVMRMSRSAD